jgi:hypothetical protein
MSTLRDDEIRTSIGDAKSYQQADTDADDADADDADTSDSDTSDSDADDTDA